jgi:Tol biopolymer transport system component
MNMMHRLVALLGFAVIFSACTTPSPTPDVTADVFETPVSSPDPMSTPSPTNTSIPSLTPTATASPSPTTTPEPTQPELLIAYIDEDAFIWTESDGSVQITQSGNIYDLRLSPDGNYLAYLRLIDFEQVELHLVNIDGGEDRLLVDVSSLDELIPGNEPVGIFSFEWHPDGDIIAFNTHIIGFGLLTNDDLHLVNVDTGSINTLLPPGQGGEFYYSPDGSQIALVTSGDYMDLPGKISLVNADGSNRRDSLVTFPSVLTYSEVPFYPPLAWSPDSAFVLVAIPSADPLAADATIPLWRISADGTEVVELFSTNMSFFHSGLPVFSPDLTQVAYLQQVGQPDEPWFNLHIVRLEDLEDELYFEGLIEDFSWIPSTDRFAFVSSDPKLIVGRFSEPPVPTELPWIHGLVWVDLHSYLLVEMDITNQERNVYRYTLDGEQQQLFELKSRAATIFDIRQ